MSAQSCWEGRPPRTPCPSAIARARTRSHPCKDTGCRAPWTSGNALTGSAERPAAWPAPPASSLLRPHGWGAPSRLGRALHTAARTLQPARRARGLHSERGSARRVPTACAVARTACSRYHDNGHPFDDASTCEAPVHDLWQHWWRCGSLAHVCVTGAEARPSTAPRGTAALPPRRSGARAPGRIVEEPCASSNRRHATSGRTDASS